MEDSPEISVDQVKDMIEKKIRTGCLKDKKYLDAWGEDARRGLIDKTAVLCLAADPTQILMWSHYANSHKGCCLQFSTKYKLFNRARIVRYPPRYPNVNFLEVNDPNDNKKNSLFVKTLFRNKAKFWKYEREWRVLGNKPGLYQYEPSALTGIIFGHRIKSEDKDLIWRLVEKRNPPVQLYQARPWKREFKLQIIPITPKK